MAGLIRELWRKSDPDEKYSIELSVHEYKRKKGFTPQDLSEPVLLMDKYTVEFVPQLFKVSLRQNLDMLSLISMPEDTRKTIMPCLSPAQAKSYHQKKTLFKIENSNRKSDVETDHETGFGRRSMINHRSQDARMNLPEHPIVDERNSRPARKKTVIPEYVVCSICGEYTNEWVSINPNKCRSCLEKEWYGE